MTKRVLIVEDEPSIVASLDYLMRRCGYETRIATDGPEALRSAGEFPPDLVLLDLMLPGLTGAQVCDAIRADPRLAATRVLMLTAQSAGVSVEARPPGADDYLLKPFATRELVHRARRLLGEGA